MLITRDASNVAVDKDKIREKLIAISDATNLKAVFAGTTVRSVGADKNRHAGKQC